MDSSADHRRPHRTTSINSSSTNTAATATSELFICFSSRLSSSSSMKLSSSCSKSILSPARARDAPPASQISLSSSLSRRLRSNGSLKGGQASPMFPSSGKKRGSAGFENPEPSSPKVTCIGQVRVKTKKQGKKLRTRSRRKGEVSFRKLELSRSGHHSFLQQPLNGNPECLPHWNQRWVHFPVNICESLRTFGADWNCFLPCRSSCMSSKEENAVAVASRSDGCGGNGGSSCGAVVARWLVAVQEGEGRGRREIELVVGGEEIPAETKERSRSQRRHVFEGIEFNEEEICRKRKDAEEEEEQGTVNICIPPKNALLLMRYKSDPVKMSALANRFCRSPVQRDEEEEDRDYEDCQEDGNGNEKVVNVVEIEQEIDDSKEEGSKECWVTAEASEEQRTVKQDSSSVDGEEEKQQEEQEKDQEMTAVPLEESVQRIEENEEEEREEICSDSGTESPLTHRNEDNSGGGEEEEAGAAKTKLLAENDNDNIEFVEELASTPTKLLTGTKEAEERDAEPESIVTEKATPELEGTMQDMTADSHSKQKNPNPDAEPESIVTEKVAPGPEGTMQEIAVESGSESKNPKPDDFNLVMESKGRDSVDMEPAQLPDCLLLMMREPKLSMEVSKETWVCSADIIRWLPQRHVHKATAGGDDPKKRASEVAPRTKRSCSALTSQQARILQQPPRSSCSFPSQAAAIAARRGSESMAAMIEHKLMSAKPGEPLVLTRCKSEPMRTAIKLDPPDACFWKNRRLKPHRPSTNLRVNATGVGF